VAEALTGRQSLVDPGAARQQGPAPAHRGRFRLAYAVLAVLVWGAVALLVVVLTRGSDAPTKAWSDWQPTAEVSLDRAGQIAAHVSPLYRLDDGGQLAAVQAHAPVVQQDVPVEAIAVRGGVSGQVISVDGTDDTVFFVLCGLGTNCALKGTPSQKRGVLLRREALELALYTFKYGGADRVVALLPPATLASGQKDVNWAVYFRRSDFAAELSRPLTATLPRHTSVEPRSLSATESQTVERLTTPRSYVTSFTQAPDGGVFLELVPLGNA
jgi:hypothetical protein